MSPEGVIASEQSLAGRLPPELISDILEFYESDLSGHSRQRNQLNFNFSAVCASWRAASLRAQSFYIWGGVGLQALIDILKSRGPTEDQAVTTLSCSDDNSPDDLAELLEMSVTSLRSFSYYDTISQEPSAKYPGRFLDVICSASRLEYLQWNPWNVIPVGDILRIVSSCSSLRHLNLTRISNLYPVTSSIPSPPVTTLLHHRIATLHLLVTDYQYIQLLASLLSSNTISHLFLTEITTDENRTAQLVAPLLPLLQQHAHQFKEFMYDIKPFKRGGSRRDDSLRLDTLLPFLTQCRRLTLSAESFSETQAINPSLLPSLQYLGMFFIGYDSPWILEKIVQARGGITLKEIVLGHGRGATPEAWTDLIEICKEKKVDLSIR